MDQRIIEGFLSASQQLIGKMCWGIVAGKGTGSHVDIDFGNKIPRRRPLRNKNLSEEQRNYTGEFSLFITCSWRIDSSDEVICGSKDSNQNDGPMVKGLSKLLHGKITALDISPPAYDLLLRFDEEYSLKIFCDETDEEDDFNNYSLFTRDYIYTIANQSQITCESRNI